MPGHKPPATPEEIELFAAFGALIKVGWARPTSEFRRVFSSMMIPGGTEEQMRWIDDLQRMAVDAETAVLARSQRQVTDSFFQSGLRQPQPPEPVSPAWPMICPRATWRPTRVKSSRSLSVPQNAGSGSRTPFSGLPVSVRNFVNWPSFGSFGWFGSFGFLRSGTIRVHEFVTSKFGSLRRWT